MRMPALSALALISLAGAAYADGTPCPNAPRPVQPAPAPAPLGANPASMATHGGQILVLGDNAARFEMVRDTNLGTVTLYAIDDPSRPLVLSSAPVLVLSTSNGPRELTLVRQSGSANVWTVTDADLKSATLDGRLKVRLGDKDLESSLAATAPVSRSPSATESPASPASPAIPSRFEQSFAASHGGKVVMINDRPFEWVHDSTAGTLTLYVIDDANRTVPSVTKADLLVGSDKKELSLTKLESSSNAWRVQDDSLKASSLEGSLRLNVDGKTSEAPLVAGSSAISMNSGSHNGRILSLGANAPRLEMTQDASKGMLTFYVVEEKSETFATPVSFSEAPVLEVTTASGPKSFTLTRVEGQPNAWSATDPMLRSADVRGTIRVKIADKSYDARIDADQAKAGSMSPPAPAASDTDKGSESGKAAGSYGK